MKHVLVIHRWFTSLWINFGASLMVLAPLIIGLFVSFGVRSDQQVEAFDLSATKQAVKVSLPDIVTRIVRPE